MSSDRSDRSDLEGREGEVPAEPHNAANSGKSGPVNSLLPDCVDCCQKTTFVRRDSSPPHSIHTSYRYTMAAI